MPIELSKRFPQPRFPRDWCRVFDEAVPAFVKRNYSPRDSWKDKPFTKDDAIFFSKGLKELSELFTTDRASMGRMPNYFSNERFRSAYLLYFYPLNAAKFVNLLHAHPAALDAALTYARAQGVMRVYDLGSGPGTASAALLTVLAASGEQKLPPVEFHWYDTDRRILQDGKRLLEELIESRALSFKGEVSIHLHEDQWWKADQLMRRPQGKPALVLAGNVLNEPAPRGIDLAESMARIVRLTEGGGALFVEPAFKKPAHTLSKARDHVLAQWRASHEGSETSTKGGLPVWGPCLHALDCPLASGRDWCHMSVPTEIPGKWFKSFSRFLGSERAWLKFSYVWFAADSALADAAEPELRRVVSDPIKPPGGGRARTGSLLLCEPNHPARIRIPFPSGIRRGDLVTDRPGVSQESAVHTRSRVQPRGRTAPSSRGEAPRKLRRKR